MIKRFFAFILIIFVILSFYGNCFAFADPLTVSMFGSAIYAYAQASGLSWIFGNGSTSESASEWIESKVNRWLGDRDLGQVIGDAVLSAQYGKLVIPYQIGVAINDFLHSIVDEYDLVPDNEINVYQGAIIGIPLSSMSRNYTKGSVPLTGGLEVVSYNDVPFSIDASHYSGGGLDLYYNYQKIGRFGLQSYYSYVYGWYPYLDGSDVYFGFFANKSTTTSKDGNRVDYQGSIKLPLSSSDVTGDISVLMNPDFEYPVYPDVGYQWQGTIDGAAVDTNLDDLIDLIDDLIPLNDLVIDGEIVNPVAPPTPAPTVAPDIPLSDVPWEGLNDLVGSAGEGIIDSVGEASQDITGAIEGVQEGVQGLTDTIVDALTAPEIQETTFDLRELFPFCIPFDIYHLLQKFDGQPVAPHVQLPFVIPSIGLNYSLDLDFSAWDSVAAILRGVQLIVYALGLAWATSKVIKW